MTKRILSAALLLLTVYCSKAQQSVADSNITSLAAFNAEQILEKMGFDNLMKALFNSKAAQKNTRPADGQKNATIRKALAAIYGAGIDFSKKVWVISRQDNKTGLNDLLYNYKNYQSPLVMLVVPVANRTVMEENILKLARSGKETSDTLQFVHTGGIAWLSSGKSLLLLGDKELVAASLPRSPYNYNSEAYYGRTIKTDTIVTPKQKNWAGDETIEEVEKPVVTQIDQLLPNGKIKRLYTHKEKKEARFTPPKISEEFKEEIKEDTAVVAESPIDVVADTAAAPALPEMVAAPVEDTLTRTEYINDSMYVLHYYFAYSTAQTDSVNKVMEEQKERQYQQQVQDFIKQYRQYLPAADNALVQQLAADTADMALHATTNGAAPYAYLTKFMVGAGTQKLFTNQPAAITTVNFENGRVVMKSTYNDAGANQPGSITSMYKPITGFWPAALGHAPLGHIQFNTATDQLLAFLNNAAGPGKMEQELKRGGIDYTMLPQLFTGQIAMAVHSGLSPRGKKQPRLLIALQLNNAAKAVEFMNRAGSKKLKFTNSYRFDENAQYLLFDTDAKNGLLQPPVVAAAVKAPVAPAGTLAQAQLNVKAMLQAFTKDSKKNQPDFKQMLQFFGNINIAAFKNSEGHFTSTFTAAMGSTQTNALYNLLQLLSNTGNGGSRLIPPLGRLMQ